MPLLCSAVEVGDILLLVMQGLGFNDALEEIMPNLGNLHFHDGSAAMAELYTYFCFEVVTAILYIGTTKIDVDKPNVKLITAITQNRVFVM